MPPGGSAVRTVTIDGGRLARWVAGFGERHQGCEIACSATGLVLTGGDGERAEIALPYLPWNGSTLDDALAHLGLARRTLMLVVRRGGYACAVVDAPGPDGRGGPGVVTVSKVGSRHVQGRTAAGGWSQQRFARRRQKQTDELVGRVSDVAARLLLPALDDAAPGPAGSSGPARDRVPAWLATGGDKPLVAEVLGDVRLRRIGGLPRAVHLSVGDPDRALVAALPATLLQVRITVIPADGGAG